MTTIACNRLSMSADSRASGDSCFVNVEKLFVIDGNIYGFGGAWASLDIIRDYLTGALGVKKPDMEGIFGLKLTPQGIFYFDESIYPCKIMDDFAAIGTGEMSALTSMHLGQPTHTAIQLAKKVDINTGGPIKTLYLAHS